MKANSDALIGGILLVGGCTFGGLVGGLVASALVLLVKGI